jgi:hypothetical protein
MTRGIGSCVFGLVAVVSVVPLANLHAIAADMRLSEQPGLTMFVTNPICVSVAMVTIVALLPAVGIAGGAG